MSRIEELIKEKCPDGVEYILLADATRMQRGTSLTKAKAVEGYIPVISGGKEPAFYCNTANRKESVVTVAGSGAGAGYVQYFDSPIFANDCFTLVGKTGVNTKYVYYFMQSIQKKIYETQKGAGVPHVHISDIDRFEIPVPPIEVQQEIVRILDKFTELEVELQVELTARKKQYQYYLDDFFDSQTKNLQPLSEIGTLQRGKRFVHADAVENDGVACIHYGELYTYYGIYTNYARSRIREELRPKMRYAHKGDVIIVGAGENNVDIGVGVVWDGEEDVAVHDACYTLKHQQNPKYISYYLRSSFYHNQIKRFVSEGKICSISTEGVGRAIIPIPSMEEQNRVVRIFDNFDAISNDKILGLQAEIILRHKQYEYYRDLLLTFERTE